jgi:hypothetical protein
MGSCFTLASHLPDITQPGALRLATVRRLAF